MHAAGSRNASLHTKSRCLHGHLTTPAEAYYPDDLRSFGFFHVRHSGFEIGQDRGVPIADCAKPCLQLTPEDLLYHGGGAQEGAREKNAFETWVMMLERGIRELQRMKLYV